MCHRFVLKQNLNGTVITIRKGFYEEFEEVNTIAFKRHAW